MPERWRRVYVGVLIAVGVLALPALASAHEVYMVYDNAHARDYPTVAPHPHSCNLGLAQSMYQAQAVAGRAFAAVGLRQLHWKHWRRHEATAHGLSCHVRGNGSTVRGTCDHVEVDVYSPQSIGPAGFVFVYQRTRVLHRRSRREPYRYGLWYQPGLDYLPFRPAAGSAATTAGASQCARNYGLDRLYFLKVTVTRRARISCKEALKAGRALYTAYVKGIPLENYPPPPNGVPGGKGKPFHLSSPAGNFSCQMNSRGSDFIDATCHRGSHRIHIYDHRDCCRSARDLPRARQLRLGPAMPRYRALLRPGRWP